MGRYDRARDADRLTWPPQEEEVHVLDLDAELPPALVPPVVKPARPTPPGNGRAGTAHSTGQDAHDSVPGETENGKERQYVLPPPRPRGAPRPAAGARLPVPPWPARLKQLQERVRQLSGHVTRRPAGPRVGIALLVAALVLLAAAVTLVPARRLAAAFLPEPASGERSSAVARGTSGQGAAVTRPLSASGTPAAAAAPSPGSPVRAGATTAHLVVRTQPAGATVSLDGRRLGDAPVTVPQLEAGPHTIVIRAGSQTVTHQIEAGGGEVISLVVPLGAAAPAARGERATGVRVQAPVELRVFEDDRLVGTSQMARIPLTAGTHRLQLRNDAVGYSDERVVSVPAGGTASIDVAMPQQRVAINAVPWAEVWVDGASVGETPIGNLPLALGTHRLVLRHPQLGEKSVEMVVKANEPGRVSVDLRK